MTDAALPSDKSSFQQELVQLRNKYGLLGSREDALQLAIEAAELHLKHLKLTQDQGQKRSLKSKTLSLFDEADKIKQDASYVPGHRVHDLVFADLTVTDSESTGTNVAVQDRSSPRSIRLLSAPVSTRALPITERRILIEGSKLNNAKFPPWQESDGNESFELATRQAQFVDEHVYAMSHEQSDMLDGWKRPEHALPPPQWIFNAVAADMALSERFMHTAKSIDLVQDAATDCSVVASLTAAHARGERGFEKILSRSIHPYDTEHIHPHLSPSGRYHVRLNFNGCFRKVVIDDRLPVSKTSRILHVVDRNNPSLLWPALLEKAYMKVSGGYDFPGSNSGTDLWVMTGWIPEQVLLQHEDTVPEDLWQRIYKAFGFGDVLVTLGTGKLSRKMERDLGLVGEHDYAVMTLDESDGRRRFLIKNPWLRGVERIAGDSLRPGTFWLDLRQIVQNFENIYLNWNPGLFQHRQDLHFSWDLQGQTGRSPPGHFFRNPQYVFSCARSGPAWILLSRHFRDRTSDSAVARTAQYLNLYVYANQGKRVISASIPLLKGSYTDSPQALVKLEAQAGTKYTVVISEQELHGTRHDFTLSIFATSAIVLEPASEPLNYATAVDAAWTRNSAGGRADLPNHSQNPQFKVDVVRASNVRVILEAESPNLRVHAALLHYQGQRASAIHAKDMLMNSGPYRSRCAIIQPKEPVGPGSYLIICSTYDSNELGKFSLKIESDAKISLTPLSREGGGRLRTQLADAIFPRNASTMASPLTIHRISRVSFTAAHVPGSASRSPLRITIEAGRGPEKRVLASSDGGQGVAPRVTIRANEIDLRPDMMRYSTIWLVLERNDGYEGGPDERINVQMWADISGCISAGSWQVW